MARSGTMDPATVEAKRMHRDGHLPDAEKFYRRMLEDRLDHAEALHLLGLVAHQSGRSRMTASLMERAVQDDARPARF